MPKLFLLIENDKNYKYILRNYMRKNKSQRWEILSQVDQQYNVGTATSYVRKCKLFYISKEYLDVTLHFCTKSNRNSDLL